MLLFKFTTRLALERDFHLTGFMKKTRLWKKLPRLYSFLLFRLNQNSDIYEIFLGIRDYNGKYTAG